MHATGIEEKKPWEDDDEPAPDSSIRPVSQPPPRSSSGGVKIGTIRPQAVSTMSVTVSIAVSPELMVAAGVGGWYLTLTRVDGPILFEGEIDELGTIDALVTIPCGTRAVKALIESATKYKDAVVTIDDDGYARHTFI